MSLHVAYFSPAWPPGSAANGVVTYVSIIRDYLLQQGHDVSVLAEGQLHLSDGSQHDLEPAAMSARFWPRLAARLDRRMGHHPFTGRRVAEQLRRARRIVPIDLVEMEESFGWSGAVQRALDVPVVTRLHGPQFLKPDGAAGQVAPRHAHHRERAEGRAIKAAAALSAPTGMILSATCDRYRRPVARGEVIPNPVRAVPEEERWRAEQSRPDLILCVGRLDRLKGADTMIAAFARVLAQRPGAQLIMVGPDGGMEQPDNSILSFLEHARRTVEPATLDRIRFTRLLGPEAIRTLRREACLTVVASVCENFPYAAVEAMAAGSPLISTAWLGSSEIITDGVTGWLTPVGDADAMADRIERVLADLPAAIAAGKAAWHQCRDVYAIDRIGERMIAFYRDVLARRSAS